ncbi:hypothetical protein W97_06337 [Coniosporium apollinis CBS 100218]|uniref:Zn(2)-C6 fungal-type domain-containing protein n=1 Tax=Coniosporium apollinis (strain CBS 100218) TaxID=1168221 RepID=R7YZ95_CONA1|nr:uncharacterized protein W97_06337 [Coniosporium apollinis CBS 100218]EON67084.1 hypothetical protein W97_06337 [Coniosporium apollinis CBS 100218]
MSSARQQNSPTAVETLHRSPTSRSHGDGEDNEHWSGDESTGGDQEAHEGTGKRKRPMSVSCELCKTRKVKCDRGHPSCGWCLRNNQLCEYKERKKPGLRAGYGRELEARLDRLEEVLQRQQATITQLSTNGLPVAQTSPRHDVSAFRSTPALQTPHVPRAETALFLQKPSASFPSTPGLIPDYSGPFGGPQTPGMSQRTPEYLPSISADGMQQQAIPDLPAIAKNLYHANDPQLGSPSLNSAAHQASLGSQEDDFPPYDLLYALTDLFFKHINTWCPILHRRSTLDSLFGSSALDEADRILLHAIVATTLRFSTDTRLTADSRQRYHDVSKQKVLLYGLENSSVKALQALVILALDLVGFSNGPPAWNLLALITRSVVQLGLSVETTSSMVSPKYASIYTLRAMVLPEPKDWIEDESRRRLFWMVYLLDRYATVATAFEFALDEREIDRRLPCRDDLFSRNQPVDTRWFRTAERTDYSMNRPENLGSFSYYIEIIGILTQIHQFLKTPVDIGSLSDVEEWQGEYRKLDSMLNTWKFNLPSEYGNMSRIFGGSTAGNKVVNCGWVLLHAAYQTTVIRLHSSAAYPTTRSPIFTPSYSASQRCLGAVENISVLCDYVKANGMLTKLGPPFAFSLWVAARVLLVHGSTIDHHVNPTINILVDTLREMGVYWQVAERYAFLLQRVLDEYSESQASNGDRVTPSTVKILADMRRCAFDLDFLISRLPRQQAAATTRVLPAAVTPAVRTPAPNELEYLDVFDFFNMPRLPVSMDAPSGVAALGMGGGEQMSMQEGVNNEFNITNFMFDANSDWFVKDQA